MLRAATVDDVAALHRLVEAAYRGAAARAGWTHEADLLDGQRTDPEALAEILVDPDQCILVAGPADLPLACVQVGRVGGDTAYIGMVSVRPGSQGRGVGRDLLDAAEGVARDRFGARRAEMTVIGQRTELIAWYERRGYRRTGERRPFPLHDPRFGRPLRDDLYFEVLAKPLADG